MIGALNLALWLPIFPQDFDRIKEYFEGDRLCPLEIGIQVGKRTFEDSSKTLFRSDDFQRTAYCAQCL